ncbi:MAG: 16S rRNA (cytosine(967)-C(5))-methyltransferase RsmB [Lachnospiraceae bacterium]|nr:16S rRNA (cytosine(967)-C(5))-methyltransferase RsmB [Lachnospiraceae bacterium]
MTGSRGADNYINERDGVLSVLLSVCEDQTFLDDALAKVLETGGWTDAGRRLITRLSKGTVERLIEMDLRIDVLSTVYVRKMHPVIRAILRFSMYSLFYMDHMPARAVVNEAVELTKLRAPRGLSGFVNGVLRSAVRQLEHESRTGTAARQDRVIRKPGTADSKKLWVRSASGYYSVPSWIIRMWVRDYGRELTGEMLEGLYRERGLTARVNQTKTTRDGLLDMWKDRGITCRPIGRAVAFSPDGPVDQMPGYTEGYFYVQDIGSMLAGELAPVAGGERVLDLCAAPGGKATHLAERLKTAARRAEKTEPEQTGSVLACDISPAKLPRMLENAERLGLEDIMSFQAADAAVYNPEWEESWEIVLADVPCSGLGVIGHKPDIKLRVKSEDIGELTGIQRSILENAARYVRPGGHLVYSTCTLCREENDRQIVRFLEDHPEMEEVTMTQLLPGIHDSDGFFMALLRKRQ